VILQQQVAALPVAEEGQTATNFLKIENISAAFNSIAQQLGKHV